jgi:hypothetical protein
VPDLTACVTVATAPRKNAVHWQQHDRMSWAEFLAWLDLDNPADQKDCGGFVLGQLQATTDVPHPGCSVQPCNALHRNNKAIVSRSALALDADSAAVNFAADCSAGLGCALAAYTTWSHTPEAPRWRLLVPLSRDVTFHEYSLVASAVMHDLGAEQFDPSSHQPARLMHRPSTRGDGSYATHLVEGPPLDADAWLARAANLGLEAPPSPPPTTDESPLYATLPAAEQERLTNYTATAIAAVVGQLDALASQPWYRGAHWDQATFNAACVLWEFANSNWSPYTPADAARDLHAHAPADGEWGAAEHEDKWQSAESTVNGKARPMPPRGATAQEDFAEPPEPTLEELLEELVGTAPEQVDPLFNSTPVLRHIRQAAHSRMVGAPALLAYMIMRVLAEVPPHVCLPPVVASAASLNLGVAIVGGSGAGKSALLSVSRELLGLVGVDQQDIERCLGSGEGLVQMFLRYDQAAKVNVLISDPRRIVTVDEVDSLGAAQHRNGATIAPTIRSSLTGGPLGQANATAERTRHVKENSYRLVMAIGVQPTRSDTLLDDADAGTPQRLVWVAAVDASLPDHDVQWPGALAWDLPELPRFIEYPEHIKTEVVAARRKQVKQGADPLAGHMLLTRLKVAAGLALLHGEPSITEQWWALAGLMITASMDVQAECRKVLSNEVAERRRNTGRLEGVQAEGTAEYHDARVERAAGSLWRKVHKHAHGTKDGNDQRHDPDDGCTGRCLTVALKNFIGRTELREKAIQHAVDNDWIQGRDQRWFVGESSPT